MNAPFTPADTRTPIKLELDADEFRRDASYRLNMAKYGYFNPDHPGDLELQARYLREGYELIAKAERLEQRAADMRSAKLERAA